MTYFMDFIQNLTKKGNTGVLIYLILNAFIVVTIFSMVQPGITGTIFGIVAYALSIAIALSPAGEWLLRVQTGCKRIKRVEYKERLEPLFREVYDKAKEQYPLLSENIELFMSQDKFPNAFATGRNHQHAAVAVTMGLYEMLNEKELEGVIAHELSHIKHYDILVGTIAAVFAGAIAMIANMMQFGAMFGGNNNRQGSNPIMMIAMAILLPLAASIIQMTVSRSREYMADEGAARMTGNPAGLQSALVKLENYARSGHQIHNATEQTAHMFIINPFSGLKSTLGSLFRTHPTTEDRIARLEELKNELK